MWTQLFSQIITTPTKCPISTPLPYYNNNYYSRNMQAYSHFACSWQSQSKTGCAMSSVKGSQDLKNTWRRQLLLLFTCHPNISRHKKGYTLTTIYLPTASILLSFFSMYQMFMQVPHHKQKDSSSTMKQAELDKTIAAFNTVINISLKQHRRLNRTINNNFTKFSGFWNSHLLVFPKILIIALCLCIVPWFIVKQALYIWGKQPVQFIVYEKNDHK